MVTIEKTIARLGYSLDEKSLSKTMLVEVNDNAFNGLEIQTEFNRLYPKYKFDGFKCVEEPSNYLMIFYMEQKLNPKGQKKLI